MVGVVVVVSLGVVDEVHLLPRLLLLLPPWLRVPGVSGVFRSSTSACGSFPLSPASSSVVALSRHLGALSFKLCPDAWIVQVV